MAASSTRIAAPRFSSSGINGGWVSPRKKVLGTKKFIFHNQIHSSSLRVERYFHIRALDPKRERKEAEQEENPSINETPGPFISQEDLEYIVKAIGGSIVGGAIIKYGSIVFPEITRPNIIQALIMISTPMIVAVLLLSKETLLKRQD
ncbi:Homoserine O-acetyltransferase [Quillaja saponaria]|uniref:Homoserine O-acetyltransferase n=1 Tax=Quillaja saponaria TaxID=32244 RepID=A0AAD7LR80_QUISA|nr:Homoserine O-acetyltransferase [Quillaja saponaria]